MGFERRSQQATVATRSELPLTAALQRHLEELGHEVSSRRYSDVDPNGVKRTLARCDVFDHTTSTLYEVKSKVDMASLCVGVGQLHWYRHLEESHGDVGVSVKLILALPARSVNELGKTPQAWLASLQSQNIGVVLVCEA